MTTTSRRYLSNRKKGASYSFFSALRSSAFLCGIMAAVYLIFFGILTFYTFYSYEHGMDNSTGQVILRDAHDCYKYLIFPVDDEFSCYAVLALIAVLSLVLGILLFRFSSDKRTVNIYYSLGIKRTTLFYTRWLAGALAVCACVAVGVIVCWMINLGFVGPSWQLSLVLLYFYCGLSLFSLLIYTVTAAIFASVGTVSEGVVYSVGVIALPTVVLLAAQNLISAFLESSPYGSDLYNFALTEANYGYTATAQSLISQYSTYNPVLFFSKALTEFGACYYEKDALMIGINGDIKWHLPSLFAVLPWFFVVIAFALLGGLVFFRLRKAENCGFLNTNKPLGVLILFELMLLAACLPISEASYYNTVEVLAVSAALALAVYIAFEVFLERGVKRFFKKLWKLPAFAAAVACVFAVFMTGGFGYENYVPEISDVASVTLSIPVSQSDISMRRENTGYMCMGFISVASYYNWYSALPEITDSETIKTVVEAHREAVGPDGGSAVGSVYLRYKHKDGTVTDRVVKVDEGVLTKLLTVYDSPACKEQINTMFTYVIDDKASESEAGATGLAMFDYRYAEVTAVSKDMSTANTLNLTKDEFNALKAAVLADLSARSADSYYSAPDKQYGFLRFSTPLSVWGDYGYYEEGMTVLSQPEGDNNPAPVDPDAWQTEENTGAEAEALPRLTPDDGVYTDFGNFFHGGECNFYDVLIDGSMGNTIRYLNSIGAGGAFTSRKTVKSVSFTRAEDVIDYDYSGYSYPSCEFFADCVSNNEYWDLQQNSKNFVENYSENIITDKGKISELEELMRLHVYHYGKGYFCLITYTDGSYSSRFLPESLAPDYVKNYSYTGSAYKYF